MIELLFLVAAIAGAVLFKRGPKSLRALLTDSIEKAVDGTPTPSVAVDAEEPTQVAMNRLEKRLKRAERLTWALAGSTCVLLLVTLGLLLKA